MIPNLNALGFMPVGDLGDIDDMSLGPLNEEGACVELTIGVSARRGEPFRSSHESYRSASHIKNRNDFGWLAGLEGRVYFLCGYSMAPSASVIELKVVEPLNAAMHVVMFNDKDF